MGYYKEFENDLYTPKEHAGQNKNWKDIEEGFYKLSALTSQFIEALADLEERVDDVDEKATDLMNDSFVYVANNSNELIIPAGGIEETGEVNLRDVITAHNLSGGHYKVIPFFLMGYNLIIVSATITVDTSESGEISATNAFPNFDTASDAWAKVKLYNPTNSAITLPSQYFGFYIARSEVY